jgi:hypothetical protein
VTSDGGNWDPWWIRLIGVVALVLVVLIAGIAIDVLVHGDREQRVCGTAALWWALDRAAVLLERGGVVRGRR